MTGTMDPTDAELERLEALLRPLVAGARAAVAPGRPDPRRVLAAVEHGEFWHGLAPEDRRLLLWYGCADALTRLCGADGAPAAH